MLIYSGMFDRMGFPSFKIRGFGQIYEHGLEDLPQKPTPAIKYHIWRDMGREVEVFLLHVKIIYITVLIWFMVKEGNKMMKGYMNEEYFFIVHNDLVLMTAEERITWMRENKYFHAWLLPMNRLHYGTPYTIHLVGNSPK